MQTQETLIDSSVRNWLEDTYPGVLFREHKGFLICSGRLDINRSYKLIPIKDSYLVDFRIPLLGQGTPVLKLSNNRLLDLLHKRQDLRVRADLHMYDNDRLCVIAPQEWELSFSVKPDLKLFFAEYIDSYFYSQSYFEKHGEYPWKHYSHNSEGLIEWYMENLSKKDAASSTAKKIKEISYYDSEAKNLAQFSLKKVPKSFKDPCICRSNKSFLSCHPHFLRLAQELNRLGA